MGHDTEHHEKQKSGTECNKGYNPGTEHEQDHTHCTKPNNENDQSNDGCKEHCHENNNEDQSIDAMIDENLKALADTVASLGVTADMLVQKAACMAQTGLDLARVNARIRARVAAGTDNVGDVNHTVDVV